MFLAVKSSLMCDQEKTKNNKTRSCGKHFAKNSYIKLF